MMSSLKISEKLNKFGKGDKKGDSKNGTLAKANQPKKAPKLTPDQIEFGKTFYKNTEEDQKKAEQGIPLNYSKSWAVKKGDPIEDFSKDQNIEDSEDKSQHAPPEPAPTQFVAYKNMPSGGTVFVDGLFHSFLAVGDPYSGLPDGVISMGKFCVEFVIKGILIIIYTTIRYPHKILLKLMVLAGAISWIPMWIMSCVTLPVFVSRAKLVERSHEELAEITYKTKVRFANMIDKVHTLSQVVPMSCCAYMDWRDSCVAIVEEGAKDFLLGYFHGHAKLHQVLYCGEYNDGTDECKKIAFDESEPLRVIPRSIITLWMELFTKFF